jgi:hypothetical protein
LRAYHIFGGVGVNSQDMATVSAIGSEVIEALELSAFALPVSDGVFDEIELRGFSKIGYREH